jgi:hypothetical protein
MRYFCADFLLIFGKFEANASHGYTHHQTETPSGLGRASKLLSAQDKHVSSLSTSQLGESDTVAVCCSSVCIAQYQKIPGMRRQRILARYSL